MITEDITTTTEVTPTIKDRIIEVKELVESSVTTKTNIRLTPTTEEMKTTVLSKEKNMIRKISNLDLNSMINNLILHKGLQKMSVSIKLSRPNLTTEILR